MILKDVSDASTDYGNLITNHGKINLNMIKQFEVSYIRKESMATQDKNMLYPFLMNSLSKVGKTKFSVQNSQYKVNGLPSGKIFLKFVIR